MKPFTGLALLLGFATTAALAAEPVRPPITGVSHISVYAADLPKAKPSMFMTWAA